MFLFMIKNINLRFLLLLPELLVDELSMFGLTYSDELPSRNGWILDEEVLRQYAEESEQAQ